MSLSENIGLFATFKFTTFKHWLRKTKLVIWFPCANIENILLVF